MVDSASIEVNRRSRRAKTDRLDGDELLSMLQRWHAGETRLWAVVHEPTAQQEDERRLHRELKRLSDEHTGHTNRIGSLLVLHNLRVRNIGGRDWTEQQEQLDAGRQPQVARLTRLRAIGITTAWALVKELFGWRRFANPRQVAGCLGLVPSPYASGDTQIEQGISKAGNKRARTLLVELAWSWLRLQPDSDFSRWFSSRFGTGGKRMRRIGIVALARRLAVALWRYLENGEIPRRRLAQAGADAPVVSLGHPTVTVLPDGARR